MRDLTLDEMSRHDADDLTAGGERSFGERTHQTRPTAAVDDAPARFRELAAECGGVRGVRRTGADAGSAEHTDCPKIHGR
jgi:hypothetical protein